MKDKFKCTWNGKWKFLLNMEEISVCLYKVTSRKLESEQIFLLLQTNVWCWFLQKMGYYRNT